MAPLSWSGDRDLSGRTGAPARGTPPSAQCRVKPSAAQQMKPLALPKGEIRKLQMQPKF